MFKNFCKEWIFKRIKILSDNFIILLSLPFHAKFAHLLSGCQFSFLHLYNLALQGPILFLQMKDSYFQSLILFVYLILIYAF